MARRTIIIGDVHGCLGELDELLRTLEHDPARDRLAFVGDLLDRGPDSVGVVRRARELGARCVQGNHEEKYLRFRRREREVAMGKRAANQIEFGADKRDVFGRLNEGDWAYLAAMPLVLEVGGVTVVHAGFEPALPPSEQRPDKIMRIVYVGADGMMATLAGDLRRKPRGSRRWAEVWPHGSVVYGHAVFDLQHPTVDRVGEVTHWNIDTGCYAGGRLTAWVREPGREPVMVQVQARQCYRPRAMAEV